MLISTDYHLNSWNSYFYLIVMAWEYAQIICLLLNRCTLMVYLIFITCNYRGGSATRIGSERTLVRCSLHFVQNPPWERRSSRASDGSDGHLGTVCQPRHRLHSAHLRLLPVLWGNVSEGDQRGMSADRDDQLHVSGIRPIRHWSQAWMSSGAKVTNFVFITTSDTHGWESVSILIIWMIVLDKDYY